MDCPWTEYGPCCEAQVEYLCIIQIDISVQESNPPLQCVCVCVRVCVWGVRGCVWVYVCVGVCVGGCVCVWV
jgi:hypothetical protein